MFNLVMSDSEVKHVAGNPKSASGNVAPCQNFTAQAANAAIAVTVIEGAGEVSTTPKMRIEPQGGPFFGQRVISVLLSGLVVGSGGSIVKQTEMTVTVNGTLPDDGTLDHFDPAEIPAP